VLLERRSLGSSRTLSPMLHSYEAPTNSDYYPFVDRHAAYTRFLQGRFDDLLTLQGAAVPMVEMLDGTGGPPPARALPTSMVPYDDSAALAEDLESIILRGAAHGKLNKEYQVAARLVHGWLVACDTRLEMGEMFPTLLGLASLTTPYLGRDRAGALWERLEKSRCIGNLDEDDRHWMRLFVAVAQRDPNGMLEHAKPILVASHGAQSDGAEFALLAQATALVCTGRKAEARDVLQLASHAWVRRNSRAAELRYLRALAASPATPPATASCGFGKALTEQAR
jgi:spermidine synthase